MKFKQSLLASRWTQTLCAGVLLGVCAVAPAQTIQGRWVATGKKLENGEIQKAILDIKQDGDQLTGSIRSLGFEAEVKGTITGTHFEFFGADWNRRFGGRKACRNAMGRQVHRDARNSSGRLSQAGLLRSSASAQSAV